MRGHGTGMMKKMMLLGAVSVLAFTAGCRQDMQDQPKFFPQRGTTFYADGRWRAGRRSSSRRMSGRSCSPDSRRRSA